MRDNMEVKQVPIGDLKPADYNPRVWSKESREQLTKSIREFGLVDPIIANSATGRENIVIGGHFRLDIAKELHYETVPVFYINLADIEKEKELNVRLNKNSGDWDWEMLANFGKDLLLNVGFESLSIDKMFGLGDEDEDEFDPDATYSAINEPKAKLGDVYQLGTHRLMCGDATKAEDVAKLMDGLKADMIFTDPPYNVAYEGGGNYADNGMPKREMIKNDEMSSADFFTFLDNSIKNMMDHCDGVFYICMSSKELESLKNTFEKNGGHWQSFIIWVKNTFTLSRSDWQNQYEPILYGWNANKVNHYFAGFRDEGNVWESLETVKPKFDGQKTIINVGNHHIEIDGQATGKVCRKKDCVDIWYEKKPTKSTEHPTMKPIKLVIKALKASSRTGELVLDLFGGSGSTLIAAEQTGRACNMMEFDPKYVDVIIKRWEELTSDTAILLK